MTENEVSLAEFVNVAFRVRVSLPKIGTSRTPMFSPVESDTASFADSPCLRINPEAIEAVTGILEEKGLNMAKSYEKEAQIASILSEIDNLKNRLQQL